MPAPYLQSKGQQEADPEEICLFAQTNYRSQMRRFGIKTDDRRRHMYIIGKTGMGKSTMMENMMLHDIYSGHGVGLVDPHGDFAEKIIDFIPSWRMNDVIYFNPSDVDHPIGFNILEVASEEQKHLVAAGLMATFKKIWPDVWSSRMEYILNNTLLALLEYPGTTLLGINRILSDKQYRKKILRQVKDPVIKGFWHNEFENYEPRYQKEAVAPIQNKIGQFLSASVIRNMVAQPKSTIDIRAAMDDGKILIVNLSKGRIGEDNSRLLGGMIITKVQLSAMERVDMPEQDRRDFFLYVDEFQNFATPSFANILSEARKYHLGLIMAHQYVAQLDEVVADAVFGNVGTITAFRVGGADAEALAKEFAPTFIEEDIVNLAKYQIVLKLMIDGVASLPFSAGTLPPIAQKTGSSETVVRVSRERYGRRRSTIEEKIMKWSGLGGDDESDEGDKTSKPVGSSTKVDTDGKRDARSSVKSDRDRSPKKEETTVTRGPSKNVVEKRERRNPPKHEEKKPEAKIQEKPKAVEKERVVLPSAPPTVKKVEPPAKKDPDTMSLQDLPQKEESKLAKEEMVEDISEQPPKVIVETVKEEKEEPQKPTEVKEEKPLAPKKDEPVFEKKKEDSATENDDWSVPSNERKKRKRKRKRSRKGGNTSGERGTLASDDKGPVSSPPPQAKVEAHVDPNQVVRFD